MKTMEDQLSEMSTKELIEVLEITPTVSPVCGKIIAQIEKNKGLTWVPVSLTNPVGYYQTKQVSSNLFVCVDLYGTFSHDFEVYSNIWEVSNVCRDLNAANTDENVYYAPLPLNYYTQVLSLNFNSILDAYNDYHSDGDCHRY